MLTNEMIIDPNVLGSLVKNRIVDDLYGTYIVSIGWSGTKDRNTEFR